MLDYQSYVGTRRISLKTRYDFLMTWFSFNEAGTTRRRPCLCTLGHASIKNSSKTQPVTISLSWILLMLLLFLFDRRR